MNDDDMLTTPDVVAMEAGQTVHGTVTRVEHDAAYVNFGFDSEGVISKQEWSAAPIRSLDGLVAPGDSVRAVIRELGEKPVLSRKAAVDETTWRQLTEYQETGEVLSVRVIAVVKGGLVADVSGVRAFVPASLVDVKFVADLSGYEAKDLSVVITEVDPEGHKVILSHKRVIEHDSVEERRSAMSRMQVGEVIQGVVARLTPFGAFVDIGGVDGLLHVSEMSWSRVDKPEDAVTVGQSVKVTILRIDPEAGKISLSMKEAQPSPWSAVTAQFQPGEIVQGVVKRLTNFGAFVEVAPGIEGLVHVSQISDKRIATPSDVLTPGETVQVKILDIRPSEERMSLSIREAVQRERAPERRRQQSSSPVDKQSDQAPATTLGDLFGDLLRDRFRS